MLELNGDTVVKRVYEDTNAIPRHAFELVDLDSLEPNADEHFVDNSFEQNRNIVYLIKQNAYRF